MLRRLYSQAGQDLWVIRDVFAYRTGGYFVDIGAADGVELSNSCALERYLGWSGLCIEANPRTFERLRANRACRCVNACIDSVAREVRFNGSKGFFGGIVDDPLEVQSGVGEAISTKTLEEVFAREGVPETIDYLSIDVEGAEERVMRTFPFKTHRFLCATIERLGAGLRETLAGEGYMLVAELPNLDAFYLHPEMAVSYNLKARIAAQHRSLPLAGRAAASLRWLARHGLRTALRRL